MFCTKCGAQIDDKAVICVKCGCAVANASPSTSAGDNAALRLLVPIGRSGWAIAAGYIGLLSFIPFVGFLALALGIVAVRDLHKHPDKYGAGRAWFGIIAGGLSSLVYLMMFISVADSAR